MADKTFRIKILIHRAAFSALATLILSTVHAEGYREFPCIECDGYDYGWKNAAEADFTDIDDCDYEADDEWSRDYVEGCLDYVKSRQRRAVVS